MMGGFGGLSCSLVGFFFERGVWRKQQWKRRKPTKACVYIQRGPAEPQFRMWGSVGSTFLSFFFVCVLHLHRLLVGLCIAGQQWVYQ